MESHMILGLREPFNALSHMAWFLLAFFFLPRLRQTYSQLTFGISMLLCALFSFLYHGMSVYVPFFLNLDHMGIHLLIAGTYTPLVWNLMSQRARGPVLLLVWLSAVIGSVARFVGFQLSTELATFEYSMLGWLSLVCYIDMMRTNPELWLGPVTLGGLIYTIGSVIGVACNHGVFHVFVIAASSIHFHYIANLDDFRTSNLVVRRCDVPMLLPVETEK